MPVLVAHFDVPAPGQCLIAWPEENPATFSVKIDLFHVTVRLIPDESWGSKPKDEPYFTRSVERFDVSVARDEEPLPPKVIPDKDGKMDYTIQTPYFESRTEAFAVAARDAVNRVIEFFQYSLRTPLLQKIPSWEHSLHNPMWTDSEGVSVGKGAGVFVAHPVPGLRGQLGVQRLTLDNADALARFLTSPTAPSLADEILSDAQSAWFDGNLRRSVLELAIACEVVVKRHFFANDSPAGAAFDYLEDRAKVSVRVLELIDQVCIEAFSRSFRAEHPDRYRDVDHLFRCRNKVAHRGVLSFRDDGGIQNAVSAEMVKNWWDAVVDLKQWLNALGASPSP